MRLHPVGFSHLGQVNADGIRYVWQLRDNAPYIESAAFRARAKIPLVGYVRLLPSIIYDEIKKLVS